MIPYKHSGSKSIRWHRNRLEGKQVQMWRIIKRRQLMWNQVMSKNWWGKGQLEKVVYDEDSILWSGRLHLPPFLQFMSWNLNPAKVIILVGGAFRRGLGLEDGALLNRISDLMRDPTELPTFFYLVRIQGEVWDPNLTMLVQLPWTFSLQNCEQYISAVYKPAVCGVLLERPTWSKTQHVWKHRHRGKHSALAKLRKGQQGWIIDRGECQKMEGVWAGVRSCRAWGNI